MGKYRVNEKTGLDRINFALNTIGAIVSVASMVVMSLVLKKFCILCLIIDATLIINFIYQWDSYKTKAPIKFALFDKALVLTLVVASVLFFISKSNISPKTSSEVVELLDSPLSIGASTAKHTVVVFTDYQCPACKTGSEIMRKLLQKSSIRLVVKNYPLSNQCNSGVQADLHPWSCEAALMSYCAYEQGRFDEFYSLVYSNQSTIKTKQDLHQVLSYNFDMQVMKSCAEGDWANERLQSDINEGNKLNIEGTPTFYLNKKLVPQWSSSFIWDELVK